MKIDFEEWKAEIEKFARRADTEDGWLTAREIAKAMGGAEQTMRKRIRDLVEAGVLEVSKQRKRNICGDLQSIPCYRIKKKRK